MQEVRMMRRSQISRRELKSTSDHKLVLTGTDRGSPSGTEVHPQLCLWESRSHSNAGLDASASRLKKVRFAAKIKRWSLTHLSGATPPIAERCRSAPALR